MKKQPKVISLEYLMNLVKKQEEKELKTRELLRDKRIIYNEVP